MGDTITDSLNSYFNPARLAPFKAWVDNIDSVYWTDGTWRYRWFIKSNYGTAWGLSPAMAVQIEGMGYTTDFLDDPLLRYHPLVATTKEIVCFREKKLWLYEVPNMWNADCDTLISRDILAPNDVKEIESELERAIFYPNPVVDNKVLHLNAYAGPSELYHLVVYNQTGKQVIDKMIRPGAEIEVNQPSGIYLFMLYNKDQKIIHSQKIVVSSY